MTHFILVLMMWCCWWVFYSYSASEGLLCLNSEQEQRQCEDYKVKFTCTGHFCSGKRYNVYTESSSFISNICSLQNDFFSSHKPKLTCNVLPPRSVSECQTRWFDHDDPAGNGDYEILGDLLNLYPGEICPQPIAVEVQTVSGQPASNTSHTFLK